jgi:hypothetical protein
LAQAGVVEFVRAWLLVGPRTVSAPGSGRLELALSIGGSAGQSSHWNLDITEGVLDAKGPPRTWEVCLRPRCGLEEDGRTSKRQRDPRVVGDMSLNY